ncbi:MotA/TolQ/ExbB proton channel family protein [Methylicorpusculum sp.]|uniref:MotA/TolQ/ExbB proton channel family protein n=1 Tax=Methylicorpusculum sp. TaxID=2713644 RepID=UPI002ABC4420|nr:MotA/TolQ/ExbB proton channel family protein [Methylicorpusculum sp.]MDZ4150156.1 MotA/TolQ/ExbB proton channel family protein [Methylicorpusculum sp.]
MADSLATSASTTTVATPPLPSTQQGSTLAGNTQTLTQNTSPASDAVAQSVSTAPVNDLAAATPVADATQGALDFSSSVIVDGTLDVLIAFSVATWALILIKGIQHLRIAYYNRSFSKQFWRAHDFQQAASLTGFKGPAARVADTGFTTLVEADGGTTTHDLEHTGDRQELLDRRLRQQMQKERGSLESGLAILATIGSISPFVGLFGTVWGIMGALTSISKSGSASLEVVAGPIGEALIATAVGIAVAVPAVIGYNFFIRRNKVIWAYLDDFAIDFVHLALKTSFIIKRPNGEVNIKPVSSETVPVKKPVINATHDELHAKGAPA